MDPFISLSLLVLREYLQLLAVLHVILKSFIKKTQYLPYCFIYAINIFYIGDIQGTQQLLDVIIKTQPLPGTRRNTEFFTRTIKFYIFTRPLLSNRLIICV